MSQESSNGVPLGRSLPEDEKWENRPVTALDLTDVSPGDRIKTFVPGDPSSLRRYEILPTEEEDSRGDLLISYLDLSSGETHTNSPASIGLSLSPNGTRYCWAIPDDDDD